MKHLLAALSVVLSMVLVTCKDHGVSPPSTEAPGLQHDIPWPSLAVSPWPMGHGNPQSTGRSRYPGPRMGIIEWTYDTVFTETGLAIGPDSTIYAASSYRDGLVAIRPDGTLKWKFQVTPLSEIVAAPIVARDGTIYVATWKSPGLGKLYAVNPDGSQKWAFAPGSSIAIQGMNIGRDGKIYFLTYEDNALKAVDQTGSLSWSLSDPRFQCSDHSTLTFSPDGLTLYVPGVGVSILAVDVQARSVKWAFGSSPYLLIAPIVDSEGHIYVLGVAGGVNNGTPSLFSLNPDGSVRWSFVHGNSFDPIDASDPTIDPYGNVFFTLDTLYCVDYFGKLRWKMGLNGYADPPLVCDAWGEVYVTMTPGGFAQQTIAIDANGHVLWSVPYINPQRMDASPGITWNSRLVIPSWRGYSIFCLN